MSTPQIDPNRPPLYPILPAEALPQPAAPLDLTGPIINDPFAEQNINVNEFFNNNPFYIIEPANETNLIASFEEGIASLPKNLTTRAFYPYINEESANFTIHIGLVQIAESFMAIYAKTPEAERMNVCEQFIKQYMSKLYFHHGKNIPVKEQPFFACFEIALRVHLFNKIAAQQKSELSFILTASGKKFPDNLAERENALEKLITKDGFFKNPDPNFFLCMIPNELESYIQDCATKNPTLDSAEELIQNALREFNLIKPSRSAEVIKFCLRKNLGDVLLSGQIKHFNNLFIKTGTISQDDFNNVSQKIYNIYSQSGKFQCDIHIKFQMLVGAFSLSNEQFPFQTLRAQLEAEKAAQALLPERGFFSFLQSAPTRSSEICQKIDKKIVTIAWAGQEWNNLFAPIQQPIEFPPLEIPEELASLLGSFVASAPQEEPPLLNEEVGAPSAPAVVRPPEPLPVAAPVIAPSPQMPEAPRIYSTSFNIPIVSYINIAFANCLQTTADDSAIWNALPSLTKIDALRHCHHMSNCNGKAEKIAARLFKTIPEIRVQLKTLESDPLLPRTKNPLSPAFIEKGEALLQLYYSSPLNFHKELQSLPSETLFYQYVYEMAKEAGVHIEPWDYHFAENNWNKVTMMNLAVQALERCLHTNL